MRHSLIHDLTTRVTEGLKTTDADVKFPLSVSQFGLYRDVSPFPSLGHAWYVMALGAKRATRFLARVL